LRQRVGGRVLAMVAERALGKASSIVIGFGEFLLELAA
jgi:hypothetical protein